MHHDMVKMCRDRELLIWLRRLRSRFLSHRELPDTSILEDDAPLLNGEIENQDEEDLGISSLFHSSGQHVTRDWKDLTWVQCEEDNCGKWRVISKADVCKFHDQPWYCWRNQDILRNNCQAEEEGFTEWENYVQAQDLRYSVQDRSRCSDSSDSHQVSEA